MPASRRPAHSWPRLQSRLGEAEAPIRSLRDKSRQALHLRACRCLRYRARALAQRAARSKQPVIGGAQRLDRGAGESVPAQADEIEPGQARAIAERKPERDEIVLQSRQASEKGMRADAHELLHG